MEATDADPSPSDAAGGVVVCDAGPLIHLDELGCLDLLADFDRVLVPPAVWEEVEHHRPSALAANVAPLTMMQPTRPPSERVEALCRTLTLHRGEAEAIRLAMEVKLLFFFTDDAAPPLPPASPPSLSPSPPTAPWASSSDPSDAATAPALR